MAVREQILAIVSHDLRNPLATILLATTLLSDDTEPEERLRTLPDTLGRIQHGTSTAGEAAG